MCYANIVHSLDLGYKGTGRNIKTCHELNKIPSHLSGIACLWPNSIVGNDEEQG